MQRRAGVAKFGVGAWLCLAVVAACGGDDEVVVGDGRVSPEAVGQFCGTFCEKMVECAGPIFGTVESCTADCRSESTDPPEGCTITQGQLNACVSAAEAAECNELGDVLDTTCNLCPGAVDDEEDGGTEPVTGTCAELQDCCATLTLESSRPGCEATAAAGADSVCAQVLSGFRSASLCE